MNFLWKSESHYNLANLVTFSNITAGLFATYFISQNNFFIAILLAWLGGAFDIIDGKIARKYNLSNEFGIQLDSFADFLTFVLVPMFLIFQSVFLQSNSELFIFIAIIVSIFYVISGLIRLIHFNINSEIGEMEKYFIGVPTPLGGILLWLLYLSYSYSLFNEFIILFLMLIIGWSLNSNIKVKHP